MAASLKTEAELRQMFRERLVWDNPSAISSLRAKGLVQRIYAPSVRFVAFVCMAGHVRSSKLRDCGKNKATPSLDEIIIQGLWWPISARWCVRQIQFLAITWLCLGQASCCMQLLIRQDAPRLSQSLPRRSSLRLAEDEALRQLQNISVGNYTYSELRPDGAPSSCEQFLVEDSSLNILELMGPLPGIEDTRDSDVVLSSRMYQYPGMNAASAA